MSRLSIQVLGRRDRTVQRRGVQKGSLQLGGGEDETATHADAQATEPELAERKKLCEQEKELKVRTNPPTNQQLKSETRCCDNRNHHHRGTGAKNERTFFSCRALASSDGGGPMRERGKRKPSSIRVV